METTSLTRFPIPARTGWSGRLSAGQSFRVIDLDGGQCADLWVFNAGDPAECLSAQHSRVHNAEIYPATGSSFVTGRRRPILRFTADTSPGRHDCLVAACDSARYELLGAAPGHASCEENLQTEQRREGIPVTFARSRSTCLPTSECTTAGGWSLRGG